MQLTFGQLLTPAENIKCIKEGNQFKTRTIIHQWRSNARNLKIFARRSFVQYLRARLSPSKTITKEKGEHIKKVLNREDTAADPVFKHWVTKKGFKLIDYPVLGLQQVLCLPAKKKVWCFIFSVLHLLQHVHVQYNCICVWIVCVLFTNTLGSKQAHNFISVGRVTFVGVLWYTHENPL